MIATGARYRKLNVSDYARFEGQGIHYAATAMEQQLSDGEEVVIVGAAIPGQAAVFLSRRSARTWPGAAPGWPRQSDYLVRRIESSSNITVHPFTEITALAGDTILREVTWTHRQTGASQTRRAGAVFVMIGAEPNTEWLDGCLALDAQGFIITGRNEEGWALDSAYATTAPGIFAVGDVRSGSVKRVASGVGEGSAVVQAVHRFLSPGVA